MWMLSTVSESTSLSRTISQYAICLLYLSISFFTSYRYIIIYLYTYLSLVYANIAVGECLYNTDQQLFKSLSRYCERPWVLRSMQVKVCGTYIGSCCIYTDELHSHACFSLVDACSYVFHRWTSPSLHGPS